MEDYTKKEKTMVIIRMYSELIFYLALQLLPFILCFESFDYFYGVPLSGDIQYVFVLGTFFIVSFSLVSSFSMLRSICIWAEEQDKEKDSFLFFMDQAFLTGKDFFPFRYQTMLRELSRKSKERRLRDNDGICEYFQVFREAGAKKRKVWIKSNRRVYQNGFLYFWFYSFYWRFRKNFLSSFCFSLGFVFLILGAFLLLA